MYLALATVAVGTFAQTLRYPFVYDDRYVVVKNTLVTDSGRWGEVLTAPFWPADQSFDPLYRPLTLLTLKLNWALGGSGAAGFRLVSLLLHALATVLVAGLARRWWKCGCAGWVAGVLFAVHPLHAEVLGLVVGRAELLAAVLVTWLLVRHVGRDVGRAVPSAGYHLSTAVLFLLALGAKEHAVIAWPAIVLLDAWQRRSASRVESGRDFLRRVLASHHLGLLLALAVFLFMRWVVFGGRTTLPEGFINLFANPLREASLTTQAATPFALLWLCVGQWFAASPLCPIWSVGGFELPDSVLRADVLGGAIVVVGLLGASVFGWRQGRRIWLPVAFFLLGVIVPCHFLPAANWLYAERWMYLPSVFLAVLCGGLAVRAPRISLAGSTLAAALLVAVSIPYSRCWETHDQVFECVVERQPDSYHGLLGLAATRHRAGRLTEVGTEVERMAERFPDSVRAWRFALLLSVEREDWEGASAALRRWSGLREPGPPSAKMARVIETVRAHGR
ncbi:MAG: hypothetical protein GY842_28350 [bacterium]|nr:hypothetical protein [bacterium]